MHLLHQDSTFTFRAQNATPAAPYIHCTTVRTPDNASWDNYSEHNLCPENWHYIGCAARSIITSLWHRRWFAQIQHYRILQTRTLESYLIQQWSTDPLANIADNADLPSDTTHVTHHSTDPSHHVTGVTHRSTVHVAGNINHPLSDPDPTTDQAQDTEQHLFANALHHVTTLHYHNHHHDHDHFHHHHYHHSITGPEIGVGASTQH